MTEKNSLVAVCDTHNQAEEVIKEIQRSGFDMTKLSIIGKNYHSDEHVVGYYNTGERMKTWGKMGAFWGSIFGFLVGSAFFWIPGIGPLVVGGPLVSWIVGALEGAALGGGIGALEGALFSIGIPKNSVLKYQTALRNDKYLVVVHGSAEEVEQARDILATTGVQVDVHTPEMATPTV